MGLHVKVKAGSREKRFAAKFAAVGPFSSVGSFVDDQRSVLAEGLVAYIAREWFLPRMGSCVLHQSVSAGERLLANFASVGFFTCMDPGMVFQSNPTCEFSPTDVTGYLLSSVTSHMPF